MRTKLGDQQYQRCRILGTLVERLERHIIRFQPVCPSCRLHTRHQRKLHSQDGHSNRRKMHRMEDELLLFPYMSPTGMMHFCFFSLGGSLYRDNGSHGEVKNHCGLTRQRRRQLDRRKFTLQAVCGWHSIASSRTSVLLHRTIESTMDHVCTWRSRVSTIGHLQDLAG